MNSHLVVVDGCRHLGWWSDLKIEHREDRADFWAAGLAGGPAGQNLGLGTPLVIPGSS